ncbi:hypothetical protein KUTeg_011254 [Tegillarca granosa]|uniref:Chromo domain-containing protein n=1 Tax=Tegillarca granosa TaxID=220873 RepID=A0ABQ9F3P9_TEGGR|nr:hypothetical protein KUTeg_011254 [Tegillarca granosa]
MSSKKTGNDKRNKKTQKVNNLLEKLYYNTSKAAAYSGPDKLHRVLKTQGVNDIGKHAIRRWLHKQDDYSLQRYSRNQFKKARRSFDEQFSREIFKIDKRFRMQGIPMFKLIDFLNEPIKGNFYSNELLKADKDEDALWFIEKQIRKRHRNGQIEWLCKFEGWPNKFNQWLPEKDIRETSSSVRKT